MATFVAISEKTQTATAMKRVLNYVMQDKKTNYNGVNLVSGQNCVPESAYEEFMATKNQYGKANGVFFKQYVQSFKPDCGVTPQTIHKIGLELAQAFDGFEVVVATQIDRDHWHNHFVVNSVNSETGYKIQINEKGLEQLRKKSDEICQQYGLETLKPYEKPKQRSMNQKEYRTALRGDNKKIKLTNAIDYAVVAPDDPLVLGCVDALSEKGIPCFGPKGNAAIIEGSKVFSKNLMKKYGIPTAAYEVFNDMEKALEYLETAPIPTVIKADGLALGKGVIIATTREEAKAAVVSMMQDKMFGTSGDNIVIEEFLTGPEVSVLAFTDGKTVAPMISSMDHKRAGDNDTGLNTGGMGTIAPNPYYTKEVAEECMEKIFLPTIDAMNKEGRTFKGCLYFGLMLTPNGPKVIEYNCRFGDPETQVVLPLLESDLLTIMKATTNGTLAETEVKFSEKSACCVIMASKGYPVSYDKGFEMNIPEEIEGNVYVAGAAIKDGQVVTAGGRVLGVTAIGDTLENAINASYEMVQEIKFENAYYRRDIGARALKAPGVK